MEQNDEVLIAKKRFWRAFLPLIIYLIVRYLANFFAEVVVLAMNYNQVIDMNVIEGMNIEQQWEYMMKLSSDASTIATLAKIFIDNSTLIATIAAICTVPVGLLYFISDSVKARKNNGNPKKKEKIWRHLYIVFLGVAFCILFNLILLMCDQVFLHGGTSKMLSHTYQAPILLQLIGIGILVPISEELFYRGVLFNRYREGMSFLRAALYSGVLFAIAHSGIIQGIYALAMGLILAYVYEKINSIIVPILIHCVVNTTSILFTGIDGFAWLLSSPIRAGLVSIACAFIGTTIIVHLQSLEGRKIEIDTTKGK